jgi:hypothetical protein
MPNAPPSSRSRSLTAEPTPALCGGREAMMAPVAGGMVSPMPTPSSPRPTSNAHGGEAVPLLARIARPAAEATSPPLSTTRMP